MRRHAAATALLCLAAALTPARTEAGTARDLVFAGAAANEPFAVWLSADRRRITRVMFYADSVRCRGGYDWVDYKTVAPVLPAGVPAPDDADYLFGDAVAADGSFAAGSDSNAVSFGSDVDGIVTVSLAGRLAGDRATGTFSATLRLQRHSGSTFARCATGVIRWSVRSAPGQVFADPSWSHPLVVELTPDRRRVRRLLLGLHGECGDGTEDITTRFRHLPVRAGRFSLARRWTDTFSGGSMRARSRGTAVVHAAAISGRYGEADRYLSRHGRTTDRCRARTFRWAAASSAPGDTRGGV